jgi:hypothetical protein
MASEVEERIHRALSSHSLERIELGYRLVHPGAAGISTLELLPVASSDNRPGVVAMAQITALYNPARIPVFHDTGVQRLNAMAVHGTYHLHEGALRQTAQLTIHSNEPAAHLTVQTILNAFGAQLPIGMSLVLATASSAALEEQRKHHAMPREWAKPVPEESLKKATEALRERGLVASHDAACIWAELPLSGDCPSRSIDPQAETAVLQVDTSIPHPIAGAGYLATISLPLEVPAADSAEICRRLNALELAATDFVPRLGAWGLHGPKSMPAYSCFIPCPEPFAEMHLTLLWWSAWRASWLRERLWIAKQGLTLEALENLQRG